MTDLRPPKRYWDPPLAQETVPDQPPDRPARFGADFAKVVLHSTDGGGFKLLGTATYELLRFSWRLTEISWERRGRYEEGLEAPESSRAAATGAILSSCATFEAILNETIEQIQATPGRDGAGPHNVIVTGLRGLTPRKRLEGIAAVAGQVLDWGAEPFQSLELLLTIRNALLHHEPLWYAPNQGNWPVKAIRDLPRRIGSPYPTEISEDGSPYEWHQHVLTPNGAVWAVKTLYAIVEHVEAWERAILDDLIRRGLVSQGIQVLREP